MNHTITNHQSAAGYLQQTQATSGGGNSVHAAQAAHHIHHSNQNNHQTAQRTSETGLAIALMGIVVMHIVCHSLRVFLAGLAVYFISDTLVCMQDPEIRGFTPPLWTMCAESISSLLIMINFSGNL